MRKLLLVLFVFTINFGFAQQDAQFSMNMFNRLPVNPGYAGMNNSICANLLGRKQWVGFSGAPTTALLALDAPVKILRGGAGLTIISDQLGVDKTINAKVAYSFHLDLGPGKLGIGVDAGILNKSLDPSGFKSTDPIGGDMAIIRNSASDLLADFGLGLHYVTNDEKLFFGLSSTHLSESKAQSLNLTMARHYYVIGGYNYELSPSLMLRPSVFIKTDAASAQVDFNVNALYNNLIWAGVSYRISDAISAMAGLNYQSFRFGYSYDVTTSAIKGYSSGSHEILLGYCFKMPEKQKSRSKSKNVRFL